MTIAKIRKGNRITIPVEEMHKKQLSEGDEVYFEVHGVVGRDVQITSSNTGYNPTTSGSWWGSATQSGTQPWTSY